MSTDLLGEKLVKVQARFKQEKTARCITEDLIAVVTMWGVDEIITSLMTVSTLANELKGMNTGDTRLVMSKPIEELDVNAKNFQKWKFETVRNIERYTYALRDRLTKAS